MTHFLQLLAKLFNFDLPVSCLASSAFDPALIGFQHSVGVDYLIKLKSLIVLDEITLLNIILKSLQRKTQNIGGLADPVLIDTDFILQLRLNNLRLFNFVRIHPT